MATKLDIAPANDRELVLARIIDAPRENVYRCWT
ncbi:MAG: polyketide cyclase, partial [Mesorhizobium sp.]